MKFVELTVTTTPLGEELVCDIFWQYTDYGVAISAVYEVVKMLDSNIIFDYYDEKLLQGSKDVYLVKGYFPKENAESLINLVRLDLENLKNQSEFNLGSLEIIKREVDGDDWIEIWKKHFKPIKFNNVTICPEWIKCDENGIVVKINSDLAFGTGEHETTSMILEFMQKYLKPGMRVLDVGTGSGILGITAVKLGAKEASMTEIDEVAVNVAKKNVELNACSNYANVYLDGKLESVGGEYDLVLANITCEVLIMLSNSIEKTMGPGSVIIMSGILADRVDKVTDCFNNLGFDELEREIKGEWCSVVMKKLRQAK